MMVRFVTGSLLLLALPALRADDPKDKPQTPAEQYKALAEEYDTALKEYRQAYREAKTDEERRKVIKDKYPQPDQYAGRFLELAKGHPKDPAAADALIWVATHTFSSAPDSPRVKALDALLNGWAESDKLATVCSSLGRAQDATSEKLLRSVLKQNSHREVKGQACLALAQYLKQRAETIHRLKGDAAVAQRLEVVLGKEFAKELRGMDPDQVVKESTALFEQVAEKYADVPSLYRSTLGKIAEGELFEIKFLAVGKPAPDIEGEDIDGKKFKLSDYKGKVVLLDFWGHW
jgi:hypothetical protein